jgi:uncharacterized membrane protein YjfL (UPF0719 family)
MAVLVVFATLRALIRSNTDFDEDEAIRKGNTAVGVLVAALLMGSAYIMFNAFDPMADVLRRFLTHPGACDLGWRRLALYSIGNLVLAFFIVVGTMFLTLRLFGRMTRSERMRAGVELERGNVAVGILLASVVGIVSMFVGDGVKALSKAVLPAPAVGSIRIMR